MSVLLRKARTTILTALLLCALLPAAARCEQPWRDSFEESCNRTSEAMTLSVAELKELLAKCDALQKVIEGQEESVRKVYLKRLQLCRNLYVYMLEYKQNGQPSQ